MLTVGRTARLAGIVMAGTLGFVAATTLHVPKAHADDDDEGEGHEWREHHGWGDRDWDRDRDRDRDWRYYHGGGPYYVAPQPYYPPGYYVRPYRPWGWHRHYYAPGPRVYIGP